MFFRGRLAAEIETAMTPKADDALTKDRISRRLEEFETAELAPPY
jgi:hypothetical protein